MRPEEIKQRLITFSLTPNKALGQNFLADSYAAQAIARAGCAPGLPVLEIGPGLGALTEVLLLHAPRVTAVEIDAAMADALSRIFPNDVRLEIVRADFLKFDLGGYAKDAGNYCAAGNLPYYVTSPICMKLLTCQTLPARMALMVQKEAGARFTAAIGTKLYGPLSVLTQLYYDCKTLMELSPASYYPQPEVDSVVLAFHRKEAQEVVPQLSKLLDAVFAMRRKTLMNNLRAAGIDREEAARAMRALGIPENARAEQVKPAAFAALAQALYDKDAGSK